LSGLGFSGGCMDFKIKLKKSFLAVATTLSWFIQRVGQ
jgi:hypothetical protein